MQKTNKAARKRFKISARGKIMFRGAGKRHLLGSKSRKNKRRLAKRRVASLTDEYRIKGALPFSRRRYRNRKPSPAPKSATKSAKGA